MKIALVLAALFQISASTSFASRLALSAGESRVVHRADVPAYGLRVSCQDSRPSDARQFSAGVLVNEWSSAGYGKSFTLYCDPTLFEKRKVEARNAALMDCVSAGYTCKPDLVTYEMTADPTYTRSFPEGLLYAGCDVTATVVGVLK